MRIAIDMQGAQSGSRRRGIGRYTMSLVQAIAQNRGEHDVILALSGLFPDAIETIRNSFKDILPRDSIRVWEAPEHVDYLTAPKWRREIAEYIREYTINIIKPDVILVSSLFEGLVEDAVTSIKNANSDIPTAVVLYDLIPLILKKKYLVNSVAEDWYMNKISHLRRADLLLSISESSRQEAIRHLKWDERSVVNISSASDPHFVRRDISRSRECELRRTFKLAKPFVMYTGGPDYRKNIGALIRAYAALPTAIREGHQLAVVGFIEQQELDRLVCLADRYGLANGELVMTGFVSDDDLAGLYHLCKVYVLPSLHEGFGLPALEAMSCGAPVIGANTTSLPEVIGRDDALFDPLNDKEITRVLARTLTDDAFRRDLIRWGTGRSKQFTWNTTAVRALRALEKLYEGKKKLSHKSMDMSIKMETIAQETIVKHDLLVNAAKYSRAEEVQEVSLPPEFSSLATAIASVEHEFLDNELIEISQCIARCIPPAVSPKQLLLDITATSLNGIRAGIQRVARALTLAFFEQPPEGFRIEPVYLSNESGAWCHRYARKFTVDMLGHRPDERADDVVDVWPGDVLIVLDLSGTLVEADAAGLFSDYRNRGIAVHFTVYDLLPLRLSKYFPTGVEPMFRKWIEAAFRSDGIICISRSVADDLRDWECTNVPSSQRPVKINWFHLGADLDRAAPTTGVPENAPSHLAALNIRTSFLMVGTIEPRKGHMQVIDAFERLWSSGADINLTIVGANGWLNDQLVTRMQSHSMYGKMLFWIDACSDEYLEKIYASSSCLIAASEGEGFGLPLIEAARHKLPIIARDLAVFREVAGDCAFYFSGGTPDVLAATIIEWLALYRAGGHPPSHALPWVTWQQSARRIKEIVLLGDWLNPSSAKSREATFTKEGHVHGSIF